MKELFTQDMVKTVSQVLVSTRSRRYVYGESHRSQNNTLVVELAGFFAHLLKIAIVWSRADPLGTKALPKILG